MQKRFKKTLSFIRANQFDPRLLRGFDWLTFAMVLVIALFGVVCIFAATAVPTDSEINTVLDMLTIEPTEYARLQMLWIVVGLIGMAGMLYFDYEMYGNFSDWIYWANIALLAVVLLTEKGRGNMAGWFRWGSDQMRTMQPSEFGKLAIIIALAKLFSNREKPIQTVRELIPVLTYVGLPLILIVAQPDVGTALVYIMIFGVMLFVSGTNMKLIVGILSIAVLAMVPLWYFMNMSESSFRLNRILVYLDPTLDPNGAGLQMTNARIAIGSGGFWGKGLFSDGSFASLNYIPDDYTDFVFAIVCETFGFVGGTALVTAFLLLMVRLIVLSLKAADAFGRYVIVGYISMLMFHIVENVGMVLGLLPVTGIPLPFISYGGSNLLTNMLGLGIVLNINMRGKDVKRKRRVKQAVAL